MDIYVDWILGWLALLRIFFYMIDMLGVWIMELLCCMFKLIMATHYPNSVKTREIYRYNCINNCLVDICNTWLFSCCWLMFASYEYSSVVGWCLKHMIIESWLVDVLKYMITDSWLVGVWNIQLFNHGWCCLCCGSTVCISSINYHGLFSPSIMEYRVFEFGVYDI